MNRFSQATETILRKAGWFPGRNVSDLVEGWRVELRRLNNQEMFPEAEKILLEFGGLKIKTPTNKDIPKYDLNPLLVIGENDRFEAFEEILKAKLYPLGEADGGHAFLAVSEDGKIYLLMMNLFFVADNFDETLEIMASRKMPRFIA